MSDDSEFFPRQREEGALRLLSRGVLNAEPQVHRFRASEYHLPATEFNEEFDQLNERIRTTKPRTEVVADLDFFYAFSWTLLIFHDDRATGSTKSCNQVRTHMYKRRNSGIIGILTHNALRDDRSPGDESFVGGSHGKATRSMYIRKLSNRRRPPGIPPSGPQLAGTRLLSMSLPPRSNRTQLRFSKKTYATYHF